MRLPGPQKDAAGSVAAPGDMLLFCAGRPPIYGRQILYFLDPVSPAGQASKRLRFQTPSTGKSPNPSVGESEHGSCPGPAGQGKGYESYLERV